MVNQNLIIMSKSLLYSGVIGTIVYYLLGWLVYGIIFPDLAGGEENPIFILLGCLFMLLFLQYCLAAGQVSTSSVLALMLD